jgi:hypothetical protein
MTCAAVSSQEAMITLNEEFDLLRFLHKFDRRFDGALWQRIMDRIDNKRDISNESKYQCLLCFECENFTFIEEKQLNLIAGLSYSFMNTCKICDSKFKLGLGGPIIVECNKAGCFAQYICRKFKIVLICM